MNRYVIPLVVFAVLVGFLWKGLSLKPRDLPSTLIDKPAPAFVLQQLHEENNQITNRTLKGDVWLLNVWASWCVACLEEHPIIHELSKDIKIIGLNYKDQRTDAMQWLSQHGNPYLVSGYDDKGNVGIDYGVYGVPETFVIDKAGLIRYKHTGPITVESANKAIVPMVKLLRKENL